MPGLIVAPCSHDAARYAVEHWHYSRVLPTGKLVKFGAWEDSRFVGAVIFSRGASPWLGKAYDLDATELCELTRVALRDHSHPVTEIVASALAQLRALNPRLRLVVSFADPARNHYGGIYQAGNWIYTGMSGDVIEYLVGGRWRHKKGVYYELRARGAGTASAAAPTRTALGKHRYLYPLDRAMRRRVAKLATSAPRPVASPVADEGSAGATELTS